MTGEFVWFDLSATDNEAAIAFYSNVLGWTTEAYGGGAMPYTMFKAGETLFGGVMPLTDAAKAMGAPPNWMGYVSVADVDAAVAKSTSLGGQVYVPGTDIPGTGRFAVLADPAGAVLAVFTSANPGSAANLPIAWIELSTTDPHASFAYLHAMFGWQKAEAMEMPGGGLYQMLKGEGDAFAGMSKSTMGMSGWAFYFVCQDCRATFAKAEALGCRALYAPMQVPGGGWAALLTDPQGAAFGLHSQA